MPLKNYNTSNSSGFENHKRHGHSVGLSFEDSEKTVKSMDSGLVDPPNSFPAFTPPGRSWEEPGLLSSQNNSSHRHNRPFSVLSYSSMLSNPVSPSPTNKIPSLANHTMGLMNRASNLSGIPTTKRSSRWTVVVIPPLLLPHSPPPPHVSGFAHGYGASGRYDSGLLLPLQPTMTLQLASIAREFSLPSTGGLTLHLCMIPVTESSQPGPRVTDDSWAVLFGWAFEESNSSGPSGLLSSTGLPIAARLEFDIDLRKARWFDAWASTSQPAGAPRQVLRSRQSLQLSTSIPPLRHGNKTEQPLRSDSSSGTSGARSLKSSFIRKQSFVPSSTSPEIEANDKYRLSHASGIAVGPMDERYDQDKLSEVSEDLKSLNNHSSEENRNLVESPECRTLASGRESFDSGRTKSQQIDESARLELEKRLQFELEQEESEHQVMEAQRRNQMELEYQAQQERLRVEAEQEAKDAEDRRLETELQNEERKLAQEREKNDETRLELLGEVDEEVEMEWEEEERMKLELEKLEVQNKKLEEMEKQKDAERKEEQRFRVEQERLEAEKKAAEESEKQREAERQEEERLRLEQEKLEAEKNAAEELKKLEEAQRQEEEQLRLEQERFDAEKRAAEEMEHQKEEQRQEDEQLRLEQERFDAEKKAAEEIEHQKEAQRQEEERLRQELEKLEVEKKAAEELEKEAERLRQQVLSASDKATENQKVLQFSNLSRANEKAVHELEETAAEVKDGNTQSEKAIETVVEKNNTPSVADLSVDDKKPATEAENLSSSIKIGSVTSSPKEKVLKSKPSFSSSLGRAFGLFSGGFDSGKSDSSKDKDKEALSLQEEAERAVNEKALAKVASIMSNPSQRTSFDDEPLPPVKESPKAPPPPRTRDKVIHMAKAFESAENTPSSSHFSPNQQTSNQISEHLLPERQQLLLNNLAPVAAIDPSVPLLYEYSDHSRLSEDLSEYIVQSQEQAISRHQKFVIAISGGSLPKLLTDGLLKNSRVKWESWKVFFADERVVPLEHADSNFASAMDCFLSKAPIKRSQIISIMSLPPEDVDFADMTPMISSIYEAQILDELETNATDPIPRFDLILLGMGEDGHTCSLFPSHPLLEGRTDATVAWIDDSPKPPKYRITLTLPVINAAHDLAFVCTGGGKSSMLAAVLEEEQSNVRPASLIRLKDRPLAWFVDCDAASKTTHRREDWGKTSVGLLSTLNFSPPKKISEQVITRDQDIETSEEISNSKMISETQEPAAEALALKPNTMEPASSASELSSMASPKEIQDLSSPETKAGLSKEQGGFNISVRMDSYPHNLVIYAPVYPHVSAGLYSAPPGSIVTFRGLTTGFFVQKFALGLNTGLGGFKISVRMDSYPHNLAIYAPVYPHTATGLYPSIPGSMIVHGGLTNASFSQNFALGFNSSQADLKTTVRMESYPHNLIIYAPVYPYISYGLYPTIPGSIVSHKGLTNASLFQKSPVGLNKDLDGCKISVRMDSYPQSLVIYAPVYPHISNGLYPTIPGSIVSQRGLTSASSFQKSPVGLNEDLDGSKISKSPVGLNEDLDGSETSKSPVGLNEDLGGSKISKSTVGLNEDLDGSKISTLEVNEGGDEIVRNNSYPFNLVIYTPVYPHVACGLYPSIPGSLYVQQRLKVNAFAQQHKVESKEALHSNDSVIALGSIKDMSANTEERKFAFTESLILDEKKQLLFISVDSIPGYPFNLRVYPAVYPHIDELLYCAPVPSSIKKAESALNMRMVSQLDLGCIEEKQERELRAGLLGDDSVSVSLPKSTDVIPGVYSSLKKSGSESGLHQNISDRSSDDSTDTQKKTARASKHIPAPLQPFSAKEPQSPPPPESSWTERLLKSPVSIENSSLSPSFYRSGSPSSAGRIISISPSLQYTQQPRSNDSEMVTSGGSGLEIKAFGLGASFFKPKDNLVDPEAEGLTEAVEADKRSETSSFSKSESMDTDCVNSRQLTEEDWPPTPTSLSRFPGDGPSKNGEFRATPLNSISPRDASSVDYCESGRAYIESDHEIRIKPLSEASAITPTIAEFHEAAKRDNCAQASSVSEKFYSGEETPRSNTICADEFEESLTRGTRMVFSQQTNVESYPTGYLNSLGIQLSGPTIQTDHDIRQVSLAEASAISPTIASFHADLKVWPEASNLEAERKMPPATGHSIEKLFVAEDSAPTPKLTNQMRTLKEMDSIDPAVEPISPPRQPSPDLSQRLESAEAGGDASSQFPGYEKMDSISSNSEVSPIRVDTTIQTVSLASASEISPSIAKFHNKMEDTNLVNPAKNLDEIEVLNVVASQLSLEDKQSNDAVVASHQEAEASDYSGSTSSLESFTSDRLMENLVAEDSALTPTLTNQMRTLKEMDSIDPAVEPISPPRQPSPDLSQRLESAEAGGDASIQFPGYEKMDPMSPNFEVPPIRVDTTIQTVSLANASEISPSIAKFHNKMEDTNLVNPAKNLDEIEVLNVVASQLSLEDKQSNDAVVASHQEIEISDSSDSISSLESSAVAISTDDPEASPHPRRHPILSEDSKFDGISKRLSLLRLSSPGIPIISPSGDLNSSNIPIEIPLQVNMNGSHSESSASDDFEGSSTEIPISQADNEFDLNRLHEITGQPLLTLSSAGSSSEHEMDWTIPTDVPSGIDISLPFDRLPPVLESGEEVNITSEGDVQVSAAPAPPSPILFTFPDQAEVSEALGQFVYEAQEAAFQRHGKFQIALSGNTLPIVLADAVIEDERVKWDRWEVFLVDEAVAPMGSSQSAFSNLTKMILEHVPVPAGQIHSIVELSSDDIEEAKQIADGLDTMTDSLADDYENELLACFPEASHETGQAPKFDLILVEVGDQGQVGGLYPGHPLLGESDWFVAWLGDATEPFTHRITLTLPVFNSAYQLAFLAIGKNIASVLSDALDRTIQSDVPMDEDRVNPAALVKTDKRPIVWFADLEASSSTDYPRSAFWDED